MKFEVVESKQANKELLPQVLNRIFAICKTDKNFPLKEQLKEVDAEILSLKKKILKQNELFQQSKQLAHNLDERLSMLESRNAGLKERLLESLGSEL